MFMGNTVNLQYKTTNTALASRVSTSTRDTITVIGKVQVFSSQSKNQPCSCVVEQKHKPEDAKHTIWCYEGNSKKRDLERTRRG